MYVWAQLPEPWAQDSVTLALSWWRQPALLHLLLDFKSGEGYVRFALVHAPAVWKLWLREWHLLGSNQPGGVKRTEGAEGAEGATPWIR